MALPAYCSAVQCSSGCADSNNICYAFGSVMSGQYCDFNSRVFMGQKNINESCMNDFECTSGHCIDESCFDYNGLLATLENESNYANIVNQTFSAGNCSSSPGCLNQTTLSNAHNTSQLCVENFAGYHCFTCNDNYVWNGSSCNLKTCDSTPGCWAIANLSSLNNYANITNACGAGYQCIRCASGYSWNSSSSSCYIPQSNSGNNNGGSSYYPPEWTDKAIIDNTQLSNGYTTTIAAKQRIRFTLAGYDHYVGIKSLGSNYANIEAASIAQGVTLTPGKETRFELTGDSFYDIKVKLNSISGNEASITITYIHESISTVPPVNPPAANRTVNPLTPAKPNPNAQPAINLFWAAIIVFVALLIAGISFLVYYISKRRNAARIAAQQRVWAK